MSTSEIETFHISVFGASGVGKSSLTTRVCFLSLKVRAILIQQVALGTFSDAYDPTQEDAYRKQATIDGKTYILEFIDTISHDQSQSMRNQWINQSDATLLVYSITSKSSFLQLDSFYKFIKDEKTKEGMWDPFQICIVGNKSDLEKERQVPVEIARDYAKRMGCAFEECSAKTSQNVEHAAHDLVRKIVTYRDNERIRYVEMQEKAVQKRERKANRNSLWRKVFK
jgi:GTPase KRas protein